MKFRIDIERELSRDIGFPVLINQKNYKVTNRDLSVLIFKRSMALQQTSFGWRNSVVKRSWNSYMTATREEIIDDGVTYFLWEELKPAIAKMLIKLSE